jgi:hypothetical protein
MTYTRDMSQRITRVGVLVAAALGLVAAGPAPDASAR